MEADKSVREPCPRIPGEKEEKTDLSGFFSKTFPKGVFFHNSGLELLKDDSIIPPLEKIILSCLSGMKK